MSVVIPANTCGRTLRSGIEPDYYFAGDTPVPHVSRFARNVIASMAVLPAVFGQTASTAPNVPRKLKDKIVFVRADPSIGVSSI